VRQAAVAVPEVRKFKNPKKAKGSHPQKNQAADPRRNPRVPSRPVRKNRAGARSRKSNLERLFPTL
jgi:hypothetical protein